MDYSQVDTGKKNKECIITEQVNERTKIIARTN